VVALALARDRGGNPSAPLNPSRRPTGRAFAAVGAREYRVRRNAMNSLMVALVLWNGLLLVALEVLITRRKQVMRWVKGLDRCDRSSWERDHRGSGRSPS
jgi:hypothetical protein